MEYPVRSAAAWLSIGRLSYLRKLSLELREYRYRLRATKPQGITLQRRKSASGNAPGTNDVVAICVVKDAEKYIPSFLAHYRGLGIKRFAFVDDQSGDSTQDLLRDAPDVDLYTSNVTYVQSGRAQVWRDMLLDIYGRDRWYLSVDVDEYLVFPGSETRALTTFLRELEQNGNKRALAAMLDIYPDGKLSETPEHVPIDASPISVCPLFDGSGYTLSDENFCSAVRGGPRRRLFGSNGRLTKFPLIFADRATQFAGGSVHGPLPLRRNFSPVHAVLLHYKFSPGSVDEFRHIAERGTHAGGAVMYKSIVNHGNFHDDLDLRSELSQRYKDSQQLVDGGFMKDLR